MVKGIPGDTIEDILVKLPVKSLIRFRGVSKTWCSLITNPRFTRRQLNQHLTNSQHRRYHNSLLLRRGGVHIVDHEGEELASKISLYWNLEHVFPKRLPLPFNFDKQRYKISGCCDGILCLVFQYEGFVLWNPRIGQYNKITLPDSYLGLYEVIGFGYDSSIDDYKVVRAPPRVFEFCDSQIIIHASPLIAQVLTLKSNTWRRVDEYFPFTIDDYQPATTVNGGIYWFANEAHTISDANEANTISDEDMTTRIALVCFDLAEEKFREVALPPDITCRDIMPRLGLAGDCLCMLTNKESDTYFDLWGLKGDSGSTWAKLFTIPKLTGESFNYNFEPVCFAKNGAFLLNLGDNKFLMYDSKDDTFTMFWVHGIQSWSDLFVYADSLVSPCTSSIGTD